MSVMPSVMSGVGLALIGVSLVIVGVCYIYIIRSSRQAAAVVRGVQDDIREHSQSTRDALGRVEQRANVLNESVKHLTGDLARLSDKIKALEEDHSRRR